MFSFDKHSIVQRVGPAGTRYSLSPLMTEQNKVQRYCDDRANLNEVNARELAGNLAVARTAKLLGANHGLGIVRRPATAVRVQS